MNKILENELGEKNPVSEERNLVSPIPRECIGDPFDLSELLIALDNFESLEVGDRETNENQEHVFHYEELNEEEEILDMTTIIEETETSLSQPVSEDDSIDDVSEILDAPSESLRIKNFKTIIIEKKPVIRELRIPLLKFPQLTMCYSFDYSKYIPGKIVTCAVLSSQNIAEKQISIKQKVIENNAKQAIAQVERSVTDLVTRSRVLLMKSQLTFQNKPIPASLNSLSEKYLKGAKNADSNQNKQEVKKRKREEKASDPKEKKKQKQSKKKK